MQGVIKTIKYLECTFSYG